MRNLGRVWPGSPPGTKTASIRGSFLKTSPHSRSAVLDRLGIGVVGVHRRIPDPDVQAVVGAEAGHPGHHLQGRPGEMRAVGVVVGAGRDQLDGVGAEERQLADVTLPLRQVPGVVGIRLGTIAELVAAERVLRRRGQIEPLRQRHLARAQAESRRSRPTPKSTPRASLPATSTDGGASRPIEAVRMLKPSRASPPGDLGGK